MIAAELAELCVEAAKAYYKHLSDSKRGSVNIGVHNLGRLDHEGLLWELKLKARIYDLDSIRLRHTVSGIEYGQGQFAVKEYDADTGVLIIKFGEPPEPFESARSQDVLVMSSLLFLVENVGRWFSTKGADVRWPGLPIHQYDGAPVEALDTPLPEQADALKVISASPVSYVWGPPGTGKTRLVLSHAVLGLLSDAQVRVGVFAPTNLALEQAMDALLQGAARLGISSESFLRLGAPSSQFAQKYPKVCEIHGIDKRIEEAERQIRNLKEIIACKRGPNALHSANSLRKVLEQISQLLRQRDSILQHKARLRGQIEGLNSELARISTRIRRFFSSEQLLEEVFLSEKRVELSAVEEQLRAVDDQIEIRAEDFRSVRCESEPLRALQNAFNPRNWANTAGWLQSFVAKTNEWLAQRSSLAAPYEEMSIEQVKMQKQEWEAKLEVLRGGRVEERMERCSVVGMTLDLFIGRFRDSAPRFDHVFLDEAGYAPLIKALALFRFGTPVTLLGDHKQLPPIVEMDDSLLRMANNAPVRLWASSAIFAELALDEALAEDELLDSIGQADRQDRLRLRRTGQGVLRTSMRFGGNLCALLGDLIYRFHFRSGDKDDLGIWFVDAPQRSTPTRRENTEELAAITSLVRSGIGNDFAIITPYKDQVSLLGKEFPQLRRDDRILTIHRSQGREWDTVVVSVADGSLTPRGAWFTDTAKKVSRGAQVMNTALSRAKKTLVLVCDAHWWRNKQNADRQLIARLLAQAKRWEPRAADSHTTPSQQ